VNGFLAERQRFLAVTLLLIEIEAAAVEVYVSPSETSYF